MKTNLVEMMERVLNNNTQTKETCHSKTDSESFADSQLLNGIQAEMSAKLAAHRHKGRHGWWDENVCKIEDLYSYRDQAIKDKDHISVLIYTSMIAAREAYA